jgi:hypothetical protein
MTQIKISQLFLDVDEHGVPHTTRALIDAWRTLSELSRPLTATERERMNMLGDAITAATR